MEQAQMMILMAEDDEDDRFLAQEAFAESSMVNPLRFVDDGQELMDYLLRRGRHQNDPEWRLPGLILLDLNMPRKTGFEALAEIRADQALRRIPVVILTTSSSEDDVVLSYQMGANTFITKPHTQEGMTQMVEELGRYWLRLARIPPVDQGHSAA